MEAYLYSFDKTRIVEYVLKMGGAVAEALKNAVDALVTKNVDLAKNVVDDDDEVDAMERTIDQECLRSIAMRQPVREELRFIFAVLKTITDLERIGDQAVNIARWAIELDKYPGYDTSPVIPEMRDIVEAMLRDALNAFKTSDSELSMKICKSDEQIDEMYSNVFDQFIDLMASHKSGDANVVRVAAGQMWVARHLERVGDHVTNMAERIYFVDRGEILTKKPAREWKDSE
ncbi:phosphate transport system regulatory protein PhoU [Synergistales bacterium]|nr:phosphate transport system regulatory protein PhoU [Synergistales bacterium]